jgi:hypothetical protein
MLAELAKEPFNEERMRTKRPKIRVLHHALVWAWIVASCASFSACNKNGDGSSEDHVNQLALHMEQLYRRELERDHFSIHYIPKPPATILIAVQTYPDANRNLIQTLNESAREIIQRLAPSYKLDTVNIETQITEISAPRKSF